MATKVTLLQYSIGRCGYYERGADEAAFGNFQEVCEDLFEWLTKPGHTKKNSTTYEDNGKRTAALCLSIDQAASGRYLLTLWVPSVHKNQRPLSIDGTASVGEAADVAPTKVGRNRILGYPIYFWIDPDSGNIWSVLTSGWRTGHPVLQLYIRGFMEKYTRHATQTVDENGDVVLTYSNYAGGGDDAVNVRVVFESAPRRSSIQRDAILERRTQITRVVRKCRLTREDAETASIFDKLYNKVANIMQSNLVPDYDSIEDKVFRYELEMTPTEEELISMFDSAEETSNPTWDNIGVRFRGQSEPEWLADVLEKHEINLGIDLDENGIFEPRGLLNALELWGGPGDGG